MRRGFQEHDSYGMSSYLLDGIKVGSKDVSVVVAHLALDDGDDPLQTHPCVNVLVKILALHLIPC